ncbi:uncharacterized protein MONOS_7922 [Monocercomonoides exilis]|uniref:uncharacterized protein n=1 Tax=Monocercomonoides exilis TaxID=2049356 RepID=UPI00355A3E10|nr:hypothetical protein MONOS_7922 [Monocercomonoides exilis]|eukprot:MONOS_7922.1-p1 / transcript=MONOS_7922.1 / gene=MONOS_7922 / organism=Monocercomonoides_exilis_PA203 / gene_product=unspecified product / transcript_product=unspecified product / location=Mono_scaffold00285:30910-32999(-) / protein_length=531 / sequence_SO=supercontig / SO=protein_coding / is_pseudo=false
MEIPGLYFDEKKKKYFALKTCDLRLHFYEKHDEKSNDSQPIEELHYSPLTPLLLAKHCSKYKCSSLCAYEKFVSISPFRRPAQLLYLSPSIDETKCYENIDSFEDVILKDNSFVSAISYFPLHSEKSEGFLATGTQYSFHLFRSQLEDLKLSFIPIQSYATPSEISKFDWIEVNNFNEELFLILAFRGSQHVGGCIKAFLVSDIIHQRGPFLEEEWWKRGITLFQCGRFRDVLSFHLSHQTTSGEKCTMFVSTADGAFVGELLPQLVTKEDGSKVTSLRVLSTTRLTPSLSVSDTGKFLHNICCSAHSSQLASSSSHFGEDSSSVVVCALRSGEIRIMDFRCLDKQAFVPHSEHYKRKGENSRHHFTAKFDKSSLKQMKGLRPMIALKNPSSICSMLLTDTSMALTSYDQSISIFDIRFGLEPYWRNLPSANLISQSPIAPAIPQTSSSPLFFYCTSQNASHIDVRSVATGELAESFSLKSLGSSLFPLCSKVTSFATLEPSFLASFSSIGGMEVSSLFCGLKGTVIRFS